MVALAPAGAAFAGQGCAGDPFAPCFRLFFADDQDSCTPAAPSQAGAQGPAGPVMESGEPARSQTKENATNGRTLAFDDHPFASLRRAFTGD